VTKMANFKLRF